MTDVAFADWMTRVRRAILAQWNTHQVPPRVGLSDAGIDLAWERLVTANAADVWLTADDGAACLSAPAASHGVIGQWFLLEE